MKENNNDKPNKKILFGVIIIIVIFISTIIIILIPKTKTIQIIYEIEGEANAISRSQVVNYSSIFNISRFSGALNGTVPVDPKDYSGTIWSNYMDEEVFDYYMDEYNRTHFRSVKLNYLSKCGHYSSISVLVENSDIIIQSNENGSELYRFSSPISHKLGLNIAEYNLSTMKWNNVTDFQVNYSSIFMVKTTFSYSSYFIPLAGYGNYIDQIVIFDVNYNPLFIYISSEKIIS